MTARILSLSGFSQQIPREVRLHFKPKDSFNLIFIDAQQGSDMIHETTDKDKEIIIKLLLIVDDIWISC